LVSLLVKMNFITTRRAKPIFHQKKKKKKEGPSPSLVADSRREEEMLVPTELQE
jgi:hypothetical protein